MKNIKSILAIFLLSFSIFGVIVFAPTNVFAQTAKDVVDGVLNKPPQNVISSRSTAGNAESKANFIIFKIVDAMLIMAGSLAVIFITISGVRFVSSSGNQDMIDGAKRNLQYAILGLLAVILSWAIVTNVVKTLYTKDESTGADCTALGCACFSDSDCDSDNCSRSGSEHAIGTHDGDSLIKVCQPAK